MGIFKTYWQRQREARGDVPDVYSYDSFPNSLREQIVQIASDGFDAYASNRMEYGTPQSRFRNICESIVKILRREFGEHRLPPKLGFDDPPNELFNFIKFEKNIDKILSAIEIVCRILEEKKATQPGSETETHIENAIEEINARMKMAGLGYEYNGEIIRIESELIHAEAVKPALTLLREKRYAGPEQEFRTAYDHYRRGKHKEAITEAAKAFESTMKVILDKRGWNHNPNDTASKLISALYNYKLIPEYWQNNLTGLRTLLESAIPTPRNKSSAHGQGVNLTIVPDHIAGYVLHMTASTIVFLVKAERALP